MDETHILHNTLYILFQFKKFIINHNFETLFKSFKKVPCFFLRAKKKLTILFSVNYNHNFLYIVRYCRKEKRTIVLFNIAN